jgi:hypothetical protein
LSPTLASKIVNPDIRKRVLGILSTNQAKIIFSKREKEMVCAAWNRGLIVNYLRVQTLIRFRSIDDEFMQVIEILESFFCLIRSPEHKDPIVLQTEGCPNSKLQGILVISSATVPCLSLDRVYRNGMRANVREGVETLIMKQTIFLEGY